MLIIASSNLIVSYQDVLAYISLKSVKFDFFES